MDGSLSYPLGLEYTVMSPGLDAWRREKHCSSSSHKADSMLPSRFVSFLDNDKHIWIMFLKCLFFSLLFMKNIKEYLDVHTFMRIIFCSLFYFKRKIINLWFFIIGLELSMYILNCTLCSYCDGTYIHITIYTNVPFLY